MNWLTKERRNELRKNTPYPDLDKLPENAFLNERQVSLLSGFAEVTLRIWRMKGRGPRVTYVEGRPRYMVGDYRRWVSGPTSGAEAA